MRFSFPTLYKLITYIRSFVPYYAFLLFATSLFLYLELAIPPNLSTRFNPDNSAIAKPYTMRETITATQCVLLALVLPLAAVTWWCAVARDALRRRLPRTCITRPDWLSAPKHLYHVTCIALVTTIMVTGALTNAFKLAISNTRPDFLARCQLPARNTWPDDAADPSGYVAATLCRPDDNRLLAEGLKSTPSGHSSLAAAGLGFLYMWQTQCVAVSRVRHVWCVLLCVVVMVSRVLDYRHHWYDVILGAALGGVTCACVWRHVMRAAARTPEHVLPA